jgi:hypothetical protein
MSAADLSALDIPPLHIDLLRQAAPERAHELNQIIHEAHVQVVCSSDKPDFQLETAFGAIIVGHRTPAASWIVTCAAWDCVAAYSPALLLLQSPSSSEIPAMPGQQEYVDGIIRHLEAARELLQTTASDSWGWPDKTPKPENSATSSSDQMIRDIAHIAWAFMLLHEIKHAELRAKGARPASIIEEERICDNFAISFLICNVKTYADENDKKECLARDLRAMGVMTGLFLIAVLGHDGDATHPPARERIVSLFDIVGSQPVKWFWLYAAAVLMGALDTRGRTYTLEGFSLDREGVSALARHL